jgi:hypothetical protein
VGGGRADTVRKGEKATHEIWEKIFTKFTNSGEFHDTFMVSVRRNFCFFSCEGPNRETITQKAITLRFVARGRITFEECR